MSLSQRLKSDVFLIMGPWIHGGQGSFFTWAGDVRDRGGNSRSSGLEENVVRPLSQRSRKSGTRIPSGPRVRIFVMGTGDGHKDDKGEAASWAAPGRNENEWPLKRAVATPYYLSKDGGLSTSKPATRHGATLVYVRSEEPGADDWREHLLRQRPSCFQGAFDQRGGPPHLELGPGRFPLFGPQ